MPTKKPTAAMKAALIGEMPSPQGKRKGKTLAEGRRPGSGRPVGSKDQVNEELRQAIYRTYEALGAEKFLLKFAKEFPEAFVGKVLNRILPATPKEPEIEISQINQNNINTNDVSDFEIARRWAFMFASAAHGVGISIGPDFTPAMLLDPKLAPTQGKSEPADVSTSFDALLPVEAKPVRLSPAQIPLPVTEYLPPKYTDEEIRDLAKIQQGYDLVRDSHEQNLESYGGSAKEQGRRSLY